MQHNDWARVIENERTIKIETESSSRQLIK